MKTTAASAPNPPAAPLAPAPVPAPVPAPIPASSEALAQALARLATSRGALQRQLTGPLSPSGLPLARRWRGRLAALWRHARWQARRQPVLATVLSAAEQWWHQHPWRAPGELALIELRAQLAPLVRRHPWASVTLAAGVGAAVMAGRPWRQRWVSRQLTPLPRRLAAWLMRELQHLPLQALLTRALMTSASPPPDAAADDAPPAAAVTR